MPADPERLRQQAAQYAPLPLRLILGVTFLYAGLDKFTTWGPFSPMDRAAMEQMLSFGQDQAALPWLNELVLSQPVALLTLAAVTEAVVGACVLAGFLTRTAAACGAALALTFWLTVSWSASPFYFGQDLPLLAGFAALALLGAGPRSLDRARDKRKPPRGTEPAPSPAP